MFKSTVKDIINVIPNLNTEGVLLAGFVALCVSCVALNNGTPDQNSDSDSNSQDNSSFEEA